MSNMMVFEMLIPFRFPSLNELLSWAQRSPYKYGREKKKFEDGVAMVALCNGAPAFKEAKISYTFRENDRKRDPSNVASAAIKFIEDALVGCCVLAGDGWAHIESYSVAWELAPGAPGVVVKLTGEMCDEPRETIYRRRLTEAAKKAVGRAERARAGAERAQLGAAAARQAAKRRGKGAGSKFSAGNGRRRSAR